ncbi:MAG: serine hydrolase domain-containing protein [Myxococcota bacterium]
MGWWRTWGLATLLALAWTGCDGGSSGSEWEVRAPEDVGMDAAVLEGARDYAFEPSRYTQGVVVVRRGVIVAEWYADGKDADSFAASWSVAKSFTSTLIGIAIEEGLIDNVDVPMVDYFPSWQGTERESITLQHVLHMASGLDWVEEYSLDSDSNITRMVLGETDQLAYAASIEPEVDPGTRFNYSSGDTMLLSGVLEQATGMSAQAYGQEVLFEPLGMEPVEWWRDVPGHTLTYCCLDTPTRQFAKLGQLFLNEGQWQGRQLVPWSWVAASTTPSPSYEGYGYQWWLTGRTVPELPEDTFSARGHDGQYVYVIPSEDLVVVRNGLYGKHDGEPVADPNLFNLYPSDGIGGSRGTRPPADWDDVAFLTPIIDSIVD